MAFVRSLGARVTVLHEGSVLAEGSIDHVQKRPARHRSLSRTMTRMLASTRPLFSCPRESGPAGATRRLPWAPGFAGATNIK